MRTTGLATKRLVCAMAVTAVVVSLSAQAASAAPTVVAKKRLARGVKYVHITDSSYPIHMYVLKFRPRTRATLDDVLSSSPISTAKKTSEMATNAGALAAINGDLNDWPGRPTHQYVSNGMVVQTGDRPGYSFAFRRDETGATIGRHPLKITATSTHPNATVPVVNWNEEAPRTDQVVGYSWYGGKANHPAPGQCSARLVSPTPMRWNANQVGTGRDYTVDAVRCSTTVGMSVGSANAVVLSAKLVGTGAAFINDLAVGSTVHVGWSNDSPGALDVVSGSALIVQGGVIQYDPSCNADLCQRNPRTAVGITAKGRVVLLVVDGRTSVSAGFTLYQLGREMKALGAVDAVNLDGGGSSTMWIKGLGVVNHPTDSTGERAVSNAIVILPGADKSEPAPLAPRVAY
ncbi:MAG: phosphodiester glycosidase family protein [Actinomycetota bacterium]|nr:phosphodiester glycosidase family protein [Actinomycetota bacterium]